MRSLLAAGHRVTVVTPFTSQISHINFTVIPTQSETTSPKNFSALINKRMSESTKLGFFEEMERIIRLNGQEWCGVLSVKEIKVKLFRISLHETTYMIRRH